MTISLLRWFYLFIAATAEIWWTYSLKYMDLKKVFSTPVRLYFSEPQNAKILFPPIGYVLFGVLNIIFFSLSMKGISPSLAFTLWVAISVVGIKLMDTFVFKLSAFNNADLFFYALIIIGIIGLKKM